MLYLLKWGSWRVDGESLTQVVTAVSLESQLESYIESDASMLGEALLILAARCRRRTVVSLTSLLLMKPLLFMYRIEDKTPRGKYSPGH